MTDREVMQQALNALEMAEGLCDGGLIDFKKYGLMVDKDIRAKYKSAIKALREALAAPQPAEQPAKPLEPDMFWNSDDADQPHDSIECLLNDQICQHDLEVGAVFTIWQAKKLPAVTIRVTAIDEEQCEAEYEVVEAANGIKEQS